MIDPKELRLGNWILSPKGEPFEVYTETFADIEYAGINFNPIPLTPEWLDRCGEKCDKPHWQYQIQVGALKWYFRWNTEWYSELGGIYLDSRFQYVHQLQNLYFSLIGQELTIKSFNQSN